MGAHFRISGAVPFGPVTLSAGPGILPLFPVAEVLEKEAGADECRDDEEEDDEKSQPEDGPFEADVIFSMMRGIRSAPGA